MDKTEICNMALGHLAVGQELTDVDTDRTKEAKACRKFYDNARDTLLRSYPWPWATRIATLDLDTEEPNTEWLYQYALPSDYLRLGGRILSGVRPDTEATQIPYRIISDGSEMFLLTNQVDAQFEYTMAVEDERVFPPDFVGAFSLYLATLISPLVTGGDQFKLGERAANMFSWLSELARVNAAVEQKLTQSGPSSFETSRN
jgi:hypothetical protein